MLIKSASAKKKLEMKLSGKPEFETIWMKNYYINTTMCPLIAYHIYHNDIQLNVISA